VHPGVPLGGLITCSLDYEISPVAAMLLAVARSAGRYDIPPCFKS